MDFRGFRYNQPMVFAETKNFQNCTENTRGKQAFDYYKRVIFIPSFTCDAENDLLFLVCHLCNG